MSVELDEMKRRQVFEKALRIYTRFSKEFEGIDLDVALWSLALLTNDWLRHNCKFDKSIKRNDLLKHFCGCVDFAEHQR